MLGAVPSANVEPVVLEVPSPQAVGVPVYTQVAPGVLDGGWYKL